MEKIGAAALDNVIRLTVLGETYDITIEVAQEFVETSMRRQGDGGSGIVAIGGRQLLFGQDAGLKVRRALLDALGEFRLSRANERSRNFASD